MPSQRLWLDQLTTHLLERPRSLESWLDLVREVIPGRRRRSFRTLVQEIWLESERLSILDKKTLTRLIADHKRFQKWWLSGPCPLPVTLQIQVPDPIRDLSHWNLPSLPTLNSLQEFLGLHPDDLGWLLSPRHHHYHEQWLPKKQGGRRLLESPKPLLKDCQVSLLRGLLDRVPPHQAATGFRVGYSVLDFARPHTGQPVVLKMDLAHFFPSIRRARLKHLFMALGYREPVAFALSTLTTTRARQDGLTFSEKKLYHANHLPQGAPTSPALANLVAYRLDCRLTGWARTMGATYTRYADDLLFSGGPDFEHAVSRFESTVAKIVYEEGFSLHKGKTRTMRKSQQQAAAGLVLNEGLNICRRDYENLKAILYNCQKHGPQSQNREGLPHFREHLQGRVQWVTSVHAARGKRLQASFEAIDW